MGAIPIYYGKWEAMPYHFSLRRMIEWVFFDFG
jgi:hypothetical protein